MGNTSIQWTDKTWNCLRGCSLVSAGCTHCYAMKQAHRFSGEGMPYEGLTRLTEHGPVWTGKIKLIPERLDQPLHWKKPQRIFVNSMSDLFHEDVPDEFLDQVFAVMATAKKHSFQVLTKRPERMLKYFQEPARPDMVYWAAYKFGYLGAMCGGTKAPLPAPNVHLGVSVEDQETAAERIPLLLQTPAAVRFISAEPLLGSIDLIAIEVNRHIPEPVPGKIVPISYPIEIDALNGHQFTNMRIEYKSPKIDWVIVGGESGPKARPCDVGWIRSIVDQCKAAGVPVFVKQLGANVIQDGERRIKRDSHGGDISEFPHDLRIREFPR